MSHIFQELAYQARDELGIKSHKNNLDLDVEFVFAYLGWVISFFADQLHIKADPEDILGALDDLRKAIDRTEYMLRKSKKFDKKNPKLEQQEVGGNK